MFRKNIWIMLGRLYICFKVRCCSYCWCSVDKNVLWLYLLCSTCD